MQTPQFFRFLRKYFSNPIFKSFRVNVALKNKVNKFFLKKITKDKKEQSDPFDILLNRKQDKYLGN